MKLAGRVKSLSSSPTLQITNKAKQLKKSGVDVVSFGAGEPDFDTPQYIKDAAVCALQQGMTKYTPSTGTAALKEAIIGKLERDNLLHYRPEQIVVSCGAKHALYSIFQVLCERGDEVIIPAPYWVSYPEMVKVAEATPVFVGTGEKDGFKITPKKLQAALTKKTKAVIINSPSNPTGAVYTKEELLEIARIAAKEDIFVISDEIYEKLIYGDARHYSIAGLDKEVYKRTFTVNGLSKAYSMTGWRIGYLAGPKEPVEKISNLQDHSTSCPNSIAQAAAVTALEGPDDFVNKMRDEFLKRRDYLVERISNMKNMSVFCPQGAFYAFSNISRVGLDSVTFAARLLDEARVAVVPGVGFGDDKYIRLSFATSMEQITKGLDRIEEWVRKL
ncbi:MAG: pyridoxal phosphate-dependent aminotransferase [Candidatus Omnitrophica bacterium]|nr:pyridoxal phosphate-dependent aminotransferase [Candidatus Omnitrophota bacterium]MBU1924832.1 pyridoxal phosphate-dependent aminotransferase [Candidatus Omnitrophota bacterium]MBU2063391.1 pyridoxal phosphate-dependent aminotransferase [Candidatus Omnitrophota bacterium]